MYRNGFTLIELLAVIVVIALLALLVSTSVARIVNNSREDIYETQLLSIEKSARIWGGENINLLPDAGECIYFTLGYLKNYGVIDDNILDSRNNKKISDNLKVKITGEINEFDKLNYKYEVAVTDITNCTLIDN